VWVRIPPPLLDKIVDLQEKPRKKGRSEGVMELLYTSFYTNVPSRKIVGSRHAENERRFS
jgi:hypothetical protein